MYHFPFHYWKLSHPVFFFIYSNTCTQLVLDHPWNYFPLFMTFTPQWIHAYRVMTLWNLKGMLPYSIIIKTSPAATPTHHFPPQKKSIFRIKRKPLRPNWNSHIVLLKSNVRMVIVSNHCFLCFPTISSLEILLLYTCCSTTAGFFRLLSKSRKIAADLDGWIHEFFMNVIGYSHGDR